LAGVRLPGADNLERSVGTVDHQNVAQGTFLYKLPFGEGHKLSSDNVVLRQAISGCSSPASTRRPLALRSRSPALAPDTASSMLPASRTSRRWEQLALWRVSHGGREPWQNGKPTTAAAATTTHYLNGAAFTIAVGTYGNAARTAPLNMFAPRTADFDMNIRRTFAIRQSLKLSVQADAFNLTNSVYFSARMRPSVERASVNIQRRPISPQDAVQRKAYVLADFCLSGCFSKPQG